jgi:hypothetical protein
MPAATILSDGHESPACSVSTAAVRFAELVEHRHPVWPHAIPAAMIAVVSATITIITTPIEEPDQFESMYNDERRRRSAGWESFPARSGGQPDGFFMQATKSDLGVFECEPEVDVDTGEKLQTCMIDKRTQVRVIPKLEALVESSVDETARALVAQGGGTADLARVTEALRSGAWPEGEDPAEEAAAFAHNLLKYSRTAAEHRMGMCWEYRRP